MTSRNTAMFSSVTLTVLLLAILSHPAAGQQAASDVTFDTVAITYPEEKEVEVELTGTELGLKASGKAISGKATIKHERGVTSISIRIGGFTPASRLGTQYTTYVLWAITPEGMIDNLGEFRRRGSDTWDAWIGTPFKTATPFQTFSLIITAEPYGLVQSPSRKVIVSNRAPRQSGVQVAPNKISFVGDSEVDMIRFTPDKEIGREEYKKVPIELLGARRAVDVARFFDAPTYAPATFKQAQELIENAERQFNFKQYEESADTAQRAIAVAEMARQLSVSRKKAKDLRDLINDKDATITALEDRIRASDQNKLDAQKIADREAEARRRAEDRLQQLEDSFSRAREDLRRYDTDARRLREDLNRKTDELEAERAEKSKLLQRVAELENQLAEMNRREQAKAEAAQLKATIMSSFETKDDDRGLVFILPDSFFRSATSTELTAEALEKIKLLARYLSADPARKISVEAYTDDRGSEQQRREFATQRAQVVATQLMLGGVVRENLSLFYLGTARPRSTARTAKGREMNRRIEVILLN